jgi:hypothetical protein
MDWRWVLELLSDKERERRANGLVLGCGWEEWTGVQATHGKEKESEVGR